MIYRLKNDYHTQRNNVIDPSITCQVTSTIMALKASCIPFDYPSSIQPEDYLSKLLSTKEAYALRDTKYPWAKNIPPREVHAILSWAINEKLVSRKVSLFTERGTTKEILFRIAKYKCASLIAGQFTKSGHIVAVIGFECCGPDLSNLSSPESIDLSTVSRVFIDDPWGNVETSYKDVDGDDVSLSIQRFEQLTSCYSPYPYKRVHYFSRDGIF